jgi:hypothetical protein
MKTSIAIIILRAFLAVFAMWDTSSVPQNWPEETIINSTSTTPIISEKIVVEEKKQVESPPAKSSPAVPQIILQNTNNPNV